MKKNMILLVALVLVSFAGQASAEAFGPYGKLGTEPVGKMVAVFNTTDSTIVDGSLVIMDTTATVKRIGVRNYIQNSRFRILGIAAGNIRKSSEGGQGKVLMEGYHPRALVGASGLAAYTSLKISLTVNGSFSAADTVGSIAALILGGNSTVYTGTRYKYKVWFYGGLRIAGATL